MAQQKKTFYSDFNTSFKRHPNTEDLSVTTNENAVKQSIKNLIMTDPYERPMQPRIGSRIRSLLFENMTPQAVSQCKTYIQETIKNHEPRAKLLNVDVTPDYDHNTLYATVIFTMINTSNPIELEVVLERLR